MIVLAWILGVVVWAALRLLLEPLAEWHQRVFWGITVGTLGISNLLNGGTHPWVTDGLWPFLVGAVTAQGMVSLWLRWFPLGPSSENAVARKDP